MKKYVLFLAVGLAWLFGSFSASATQPKQPLNVLFIAVDDLRPELGCYGHPVVKSPNIDKLAKRGTVFLRAYCQQAVCNPSRASLMTGLRPDTLKVYDLPTHFRDRMPNAVTIAQWFRQHGYFTERIGKIFHTGHGNRDDNLSWSRSKNYPSAPRYGPEGQMLLQRLTKEAKDKGLDLKERKNQPRGLPWEVADVADDALADGKVADNAVQMIREANKKDQPFFLAVGFVNPHLPFVAPKKYWDMYSPEQIKLADNPNPPKDAPGYAVHDSGELRAYHGIPAKGPLSKEQAAKMVHGYWAAVSYIDAQVGKLLDELDRLGIRDNTVVIIWGDHGWQLGEHGMWCKHTNYETSAHAPLIISVPGQKAPGQKTDALVEFVDIFPSLVDVCRLPAAKKLDGISFGPLLDDAKIPWKKAAFNLYPRNIPKVGAGMGRAIRTDRYRLVEWTVEGKDFREYELYDHKTDPGENINLANRPEHAALVRALTDQLHAGCQAALPPGRKLSANP
jgi:iduronate 2-sulfatase